MADRTAATAVATTGPLTDRWLGRLGSVRVRITVAATLVSAVAVALAGWLLIRSVERTQLGRLRHDVEQGVDEVADKLRVGEPWEAAVWNVADVIITDEQGEVVGSNPAVQTDPLGRQLAVFLGEPQSDASGGATVIAGNDPIDSLGPPIPPGDDPSEVRRAATFSVRIDGPHEQVTRQVDTDRYGTVAVTASAPASEVERSVEAVGKALWVLLPSLVAGVALVAWWLAGRALRPVEAIRREAAAIGGATIHRRVPEPDSEDEIGRLARTMNAMLERLDHAAKQQRQFVSDASHELRSPVAAIRTDLEVALHEGDRADWSTVARAVLAEEARLETLLADLLLLASDDESAATAPPAMVDMGQVADDVVRRGRRVSVVLDRSAVAGREPEALVVAGVPTRLERALANLVDNAARYAAGSVRVTVSRRGDHVRVAVDDDGPGIPAPDRDRIFERFTRLDASRTRDDGGAGLGLAVVRSIATRHGGSVWADQSPLGGARLILELPAVGATSATRVDERG